MTNEKIQELAYRHCRAYKHAEDANGRAYTFDGWTLLHFARALLSASIADTAGAKPVACRFNSCSAPFVCNRAGKCQMENMQAQDTAPPAPSVADDFAVVVPTETGWTATAPSVADAAGASEDDAWPSAKDAAIKACALMIRGICMTKPQDQWTALIEKRIRFMLKESK